MNLEQVNREQRYRGRRTLLLLMGVFALPLILAFWLYYGSGWRPAASNVNGELFQPVRPLPTLSVPAVTESGAAVPVTLDGYWTLLSLSGAICDADCAQTLIYTRQVQAMLGRLSTRVQRVWLNGGECCDWRMLEREHPELKVAWAAGDAASALLASFPVDRQPQDIYVIDPRGNLVMRYDSRRNPQGLREDLKKLLDLSHIG